jgi:hypothetical protein
MDRRLLLAALACAPLVHLHAQDEARPHYRIAAGELSERLAQRFPVRLDAAGIFELRIEAPRLFLLPATQQLGATLQARLSGAQLPRPESGEMDVAFRLRYEPSDRTLRAHHLQVLDLRWPGLDADSARTLQALLPALAREAVGEIVLHRFTHSELALADTMGFEPDTITVESDGLLVTFAPKPAPRL